MPDTTGEPDETTGETVELAFYRYVNKADRDDWADDDPDASYEFEEGDQILVMPDDDLGLEVIEVDSPGEAEQHIFENCIPPEETDVGYQIDAPGEHTFGPIATDGHGVVQIYQLYHGDRVTETTPAGNGNFSSSETWREDGPFWHGWIVESGGWYFDCESIGVTERMANRGVEA